MHFCNKSSSAINAGTTLSTWNQPGVTSQGLGSHRTVGVPPQSQVAICPSDSPEAAAPPLSLPS